MTLNTQDAPHIRHHESTRTLMLDAILVLAVIYGMAFYYYGPRIIGLGLAAVLSSVLLDAVGTFMRGSRPNIRDLSAVVTGMILPLLMPVSVSYSVVFIAVTVAVLISKHPFGGVGHNVFNPAAVGFSFVAICYPAQLFTYPVPLTQQLPMFGPVGEFLTGVSPEFTLKLGGVPKYDILDMALGNYPGPAGATNILVILACLLYLVFRNTVRWEMPVSFFITVSALAFLFPRGDVSGWQSVAFELMSGILLFGGVFLLGDPVTTPKRDFSKVVFGVISGIMVMLFRRYGLMEEEFTFALLLMNASVWGIDMSGEYLHSIIRRKRFETFNGKKIQKKA